MNLGRKRPILLKDTPASCPHCESMGWQFSSLESSKWNSFLELSLLENVTEFIFSLESVLNPAWYEFSALAKTKGFKVSVWNCGEKSHSALSVQSISSRIETCHQFYPLVSDFKELYELKDRWSLGTTPLHLCFHERKKALTLKLFELELKQDLFPVWGVFPPTQNRPQVGISAESLHALFFKTRGKKLRQGLSPMPGLEMLDVRHEAETDLKPSGTQWVLGTRRPKFSIVIPCFGEPADIAMVFEQLLKLNSTDFEVICVDDGNPEVLDQLFAQYIAKGLQGSYLRLNWDGDFASKAFRAGRARNFGAQYARGEILCFLDSDILIDSDYLQEVELALSKADLVQAHRYDFEPESKFISFKPTDLKPLNSYWERFKAAAQGDWNSVKHPWKYICTHSLSLRRSLFLEVGGFHSVFNSYGYEDTELGFRCHKLGKRFKLLTKPVVHLNREDAYRTYKSSHTKRYAGLRRSGSFFMRNNWDQEVFAHSHYLFDSKRSKWSMFEAIGNDLFNRALGRPNSI